MSNILPMPGLPCPDWLGDYGQSKWAETLPLVQALHGEAFGRLQIDCLGSYCEAYEAMRMAMERIRELKGQHEVSGPNGALYPHPAIGEKNKAIERMRKFAADLGMIPGKVKAKPKEQVQKRKPA